MKRTVLVVCILLFTFGAVAAESSPADQGPWWLGHVVTFAGIVVAALMIVYQLGRQHANETERQAENFKGQLRLQIYQEFDARLAAAADTAGAAAMYAMTSHTHTAIFGKQVAKGINPSPIPDRALHFIDRNAAATGAAIEVVFLVEKYYIVHPDLDIFRTAISSALHDVNLAFHNLFNFMLTHFPVDATTPSCTQVQNVKVFSEFEMHELHRFAGAYQNATMDLDCYLMDMRVELQTLLLGHLFPNTVPRRRPADPSKKVISLHPAQVKSLRQYFLKNTDWGRNAVRKLLDTHREFHG